MLIIKISLVPFFSEILWAQYLFIFFCNIFFFSFLWLETQNAANFVKHKSIVYENYFSFSSKPIKEYYCCWYCIESRLNYFSSLLPIFLVRLLFHLVLLLFYAILLFEFEKRKMGFIFIVIMVIDGCWFSTVAIPLCSLQIVLSFQEIKKSKTYWEFSFHFLFLITFLSFNRS